MDDHGVTIGTDGLARCPWAGSDPLYVAYHDEEWGRELRGEDALFERICLEAFQSGLAWITILRKRETFREAFHNFDPEAVARFKEKDIARLLENPGIIRSRAKIEATIHGARIFLASQAAGEDLSQWVWNFAGGKPILNTTGVTPAQTPLSAEISAALKKRGYKFVGPVIVYAWMQAIGIVNDHAPDCFRRKVAAANK